jgi:hypothetical protein
MSRITTSLCAPGVGLVDVDGFRNKDCPGEVSSSHQTQLTPMNKGTL